MAVWLDSKYANLLSGRVQKFKRVQNNFNLRCPLCGDSKKSQSKARGWILFKNSKTRYFCFNCGASMPFRSFLKKIDESLFLDYVKESLLDQGHNPEVIDFAQKLKTPKFVSSTQLSTLKKVSQLHPDHPVKRYIDKRRIPTEYHFKLFYAPKYKHWINSILPDRFKLDYDEPRIIIPLLSEDKELMGVQCRSLDPRAEVKYITMLFDENNPKVYGLENLDKSQLIYAVEGPIDAMFLTNAIASCGGKIDTIVKSCGILKENVIIVYDNEPRNKETIKKMEDAISDGYKVCIWPEQIKQKDINDMVLEGLTQEYIESTIKQNSYFGPSAMLMLSAWRKV